MVSWICRKNKSSWEVTGGLVVRILGHCGGPGSIPGLKTKILKAAWHSQREKKLLHLLKYLISTDWLTHTLNKKLLGLPWWLRQQRICLQCRRCGFDPWVRKISWRKEWLPTPVFLPEEPHGQRSLGGPSPWGRKESDTTNAFTFFHHLRC